MSYVKTQEYLLCIEPLMAEETLVTMTSTSYPHQKQSAAKRIEKELKHRTTRNLQPKRTQTSTGDMYRELVRTLGNG
jgi:hypothetical protein